MAVSGPVRWAFVGFCCLIGATVLWAQGPSRGSYRGRGGPRGDDKKEDFKLPEDQRLLKIHESFVKEAEKLALEYEKTNQFDKARSCYEEILRLVPVYTNAQSALDKVKTKQYSAETKKFDVLANKGWQDSGVIVGAGKPIIIRADGSWTFRMTLDLSADGIEIPKELQAFRLGALIGMIDDGSGTAMHSTSNSREDRDGDGGRGDGGRSEGDRSREDKNGPFLVGSQYEFTPEKNGKLLLRMYDADPTDNQGKMNVQISGSFYHPNKK